MDKTIMVVDDEQVFHDLYTEMLDGTEYRLIHVYDGDEALLECTARYDQLEVNAVSQLEISPERQAAAARSGQPAPTHRCRGRASRTGR